MQLGDVVQLPNEEEEEEEEGDKTLAAAVVPDANALLGLVVCLFEEEGEKMAQVGLMLNLWCRLLLLLSLLCRCCGFDANLVMPASLAVIPAVDLMSTLWCRLLWLLSHLSLCCGFDADLVEPASLAAVVAVLLATLRDSAAAWALKEYA